MSLNFTQITNKIWKSTKQNNATYPLDDGQNGGMVADINLALDELYCEALRNNGWNVDDYNQSDYPIITCNLVAGQRDYTFIKDQSGNLVLDIYKVQVMNTSTGKYCDLKPVDQQTNSKDPNIVPPTMTDGLNTQGIPTTYDLTANGFFLDLIPSTSIINGLKVFIDREPTYFTASDTTKVPGIDGLTHDYLYLKPAYEWARDNGGTNVQELFRDVGISFAKVQTRYGVREKNINRRMDAGRQNNK